MEQLNAAVNAPPDVVFQDENTVKINPGATGISSDNKIVSLICTPLSIFLGVFLETGTYPGHFEFRRIVADMFVNASDGILYGEPRDVMEQLKSKWSDFCKIYLGDLYDLEVQLKYIYQNDALETYNINVGTEKKITVVITPDHEHYYTWVPIGLWNVEEQPIEEIPSGSNPMESMEPIDYSERFIILDNNYFDGVTSRFDPKYREGIESVLALIPKGPYGVGLYKLPESKMGNYTIDDFIESIFDGYGNESPAYYKAIELYDL